MVDGAPELVDRHPLAACSRALSRQTARSKTSERLEIRPERLEGYSCLLFDCAVRRHRYLSTSKTRLVVLVPAAFPAKNAQFSRIFEGTPGMAIGLLTSVEAAENIAVRREERDIPLS